MAVMGEVVQRQGWSGWSLPTLLAPMEGITDPVFRGVMVAQGGVGMVCTEFVRISRAPLSLRALRREVVRPTVGGVGLSVQVMGREADKMADAARCIAAAGADVVDINLGCPAPRVVRDGVGAAMLRDPVLLREVVGAMRAAVPGVLSAKMRAGDDDAGVALRNGRVLVEAGVDYVAVHPRRRVDGYQGVADWRVIRRLGEALPVPVVGNGDVWYAEDALRMMEETGCAAVMIGRPAMRNPWILRQVAALLCGEPAFEPSGDDALAYVSGLRRAYALADGRPMALGRLKEHLGWMLRAVPDGGEARRRALRAQTCAELEEVLEVTWRGRGPEELDWRARGGARLECSGSALA